MICSGIWRILLISISVHWCTSTFPLFRPADPQHNNPFHAPAHPYPPQNGGVPGKNCGNNTSGNNTAGCRPSNSSQPFQLPPFPAIPAPPQSRPGGFKVEFVPLGSLLFGGLNPNRGHGK